MGGVHDLDHIKLDLNEGPLGAASKIISSSIQPKLNRSIQTSKVNPKLEFYLSLVGSTRGVALLKLIEDLLGSDGVYVFGELLESQPIKELLIHPTYSSHYELLEIFAYGTWKQYRDRQDHLPKLNENQTRKLKLLSIVDRGSRSRIIRYSELLEELEIRETQDLEELVIDAIYSGLLKARLDQRYSRLEVESCMGRDVRLRPIVVSDPNDDDGDVDMDKDPKNDPKTQSLSSHNSLSGLRSHLARWRDCTAKVLDQLDNQIELIRQKDQEKFEIELAQSAVVESVVQSIHTSLTSSNNNQNSNDKGQPSRKGKEKEKEKDDDDFDHQMEIDNYDSSTLTKTRKRTRQ